MKLRVRMRAVLAKRCAALALALLLSVCAALPAHDNRKSKGVII